MTSVSGSAISAISDRSSEPVVNESAVRNSEESAAPAIATTSSRPISSASQRPAQARSRLPPVLPSEAVAVSAGGAAGGVVSACTAGAPSPQGGVDTEADESVECDRGQQQRTDGGLLPERLDLEDDQRGGDRAQQQRAECRAVDAARASEDGNATDDGRRDHRQLVASAGGRVDGAETRGEQHPAEARQPPGQHERRQDPPLRSHAGEPRAVRVGPDRVQLTPGAKVAQPLPDEPDHHERDQHEHRHAEHRVRTDVQERVRKRLGVDLPAARPEERQSAEGIQRPQRHDECGDLAPCRQHSVEQSAGGAERDAQDEDGHERHPRVLGEQVTGQEGGQAEHRALREVDVAGDDDQRLACGEDGEDRRVDREVAQRVRVDETRLQDRGHRDQDRQRDEDAELADTEHPLRQVARARALDGGDGFGAHAATSPTCPVARRITLSSSASARLSSPVRRPSCMTSTRSAMPRTSGSSLEIMSTATPSPASSLISRCTSALVPTSMPRVGSSTISSFGLVASHLPSTTFCWLPPDSVPTLSPSRWYLSCSRAAHSSASGFSAPLRISPVRASARRRVSDTLRAIERSITSPCWRRSSGTKPRAGGGGGGGRPPGSCCPAPSTRRASALSMPKIARATSLRPAPTSPASATISPARTSSETSKNTPSRGRRSTFSIGSPTSASCFGKSALRSRPTMRRTISSVVMSAVLASWTTAPSRMTVTVSEIVSTSSRRWGMNSTAAPCSCSARTTVNSRSTSGPESAAVGSSMISTRASRLRALAISTICWSAIERPRTGRSGSRRTPRRSSRPLTWPCMAPRSMRLRPFSGWKPMTTFSATLRSGNSVGSW